MASWTRAFIMLVATLLVPVLTAGVVPAREQDLAKHLLQAAHGLQMPGSEADS